MDFEKNEPFERNLNDLILILKKILSSIPTQDKMSQNPAKGSNSVNFNFCFFSLFPMSEEEMEAMEDMLNDFPAHEPEDKEASFSSKLNPSDLSFFRRHGISF